jgi:hypothetical protein
MNWLKKLFSGARPIASYLGRCWKTQSPPIVSNNALNKIERLIAECRTLAEPEEITDRRVLFHLRCAVTLEKVKRILLGDFGELGRDIATTEVREGNN